MSGERSQDDRVLTIIVNFGTAGQAATALSGLSRTGRFEHHVVVWENGDERDFMGYPLGSTWLLGRTVVSYVGGIGNRGYARAVNDSYGWWKTSFGTAPAVVHCMNPDVTSAASALEELVAAVLSGGWDVVGPVTRFDDGRLRPSSYPPIRPAMAWVSFLRLGLYRRLGSRFNPGVGVISVSVIDGAFLVSGFDMWERLQGLESQCAISGDDQDYCRRVSAIGGRIGLVRSAEVVHVGGVTRFRRREMSHLSSIHSTLRYIAQYHPRWLPWCRISIALATGVRSPSLLGLARAKWALGIPTNRTEEAGSIEEEFVVEAERLGGRLGRLLAANIRSERH